MNYNKLFKHILVSTLFITALSPAISYSQHYYVSPLDMIEKPKKNDVKEPVKEIEPAREQYTQEEIYKLNILLEEQNYIKFYEVFQELNVQKQAQYQYLSSKKYLGHVPLYWLLADYHAKEKDIEDAHKWLYIATIMTQQDAEICTDTTSTGASRKLMRAFPTAPEVTRATPEYIYPVMKEVIFFVENIKERSNPIWACNFGEEYLPPQSNVLINKNNWENTRRIVLARYKEKFPN